MFLKRVLGLLLVAVVFSNSAGFAGDSSVSRQIGDENVLVPGALGGAMSGTEASSKEPEELAGLMASAEDAAPVIHDDMKAHIDKLPTIFELAARLDIVKDKLEKSVGRSGLIEAVEKDEVVFHIDGIGKAEIKMIKDGDVPAFVSRIVLDANDVAYYIINQGEVSPNSRHLRQLISRTHIDAGPVVRRDADGNPIVNSKGRPKLTDGRDMMIIWLNSGETAGNDGSPTVGGLTTEWLPKQKVMSKRWWKEWWWARYKKPTKADFTMAVFWGVLVQGAQVSAVSWATKGHVDKDTLLWYMSFGLGIGTYISTYKNIVTSGYNRLLRTLKAQPVSLVHSFGTILLIGDKKCRNGESQNCAFEDRVSSLNIMTPEGLQKVGSIGASEIMDAYAGDYWSQLSKFYEDARLNVEPVRPFTATARFLAKITGITALTGWSPTLKWDLEWNRNTFRNQLIRTIGPGGLGIAQRFTIGATDLAKIPNTDFTMPVFQLGGIPIVLGASKYLSRRLANEYRGYADLNPDLEGKAKQLDALAQKFELQWANSFGVAIDPLVTNHWQTDPFAEVAIRIASSATNVTRSTWSLLNRAENKARAVGLGAATLAVDTSVKVARAAGRGAVQVGRHIENCVELMLQALNTDLRDLEIKGLSPQNLRSLPRAKAHDQTVQDIRNNPVPAWKIRESDTD